MRKVGALINDNQTSVVTHLRCKVERSWGGIDV